MKKITLLFSSSLILAGCVATTAQIKVPDSLQSSEKAVLTTDGAFWGLSKKGTFDLAGEYQGRYDREATGSSWFGSFIDTNGAISLQHLPVNSQLEKDTLVIATVASALSWRPKN